MCSQESRSTNQQLYFEEYKKEKIFILYIFLSEKSFCIVEGVSFFFFLFYNTGVLYIYTPTPVG